MTTPAPGSADDWAGMCSPLPSHQAEVMASHGGQPSPEVQSATHGAGTPAVDNGYGSDQVKYSGGIC